MCLIYKGDKGGTFMKHKIALFILALIVSVCGFWNGTLESQAEEMGEDMDMSYLLTEDALIGYANLQTRGIYLLDGHSIINKASSTKIGAGGITNAAQYCKVSVLTIVERQTSTGWARVTSWSASNDYAVTAAVSKSLTVGTGYYYRVRSTHYAASDTSSSWTNALYM